MSDQQLLELIACYTDFRSIEPKHSDQEDFKSVYIGNLVTMLKAAYKQGKLDGQP